MISNLLNTLNYLIIRINTMRNSYKKIELPRDYAQLLLDRQIAVKLAIQPLQDNICALLQLYSQGFQYYESVGSYKYKFFDLKMREVFERKQKDEKTALEWQLIKNNDSKKEENNMVKQLKKSVLQKNRYLNKVESETKSKTNQQSLEQLLLVGQEKMLEVNMRIRHEIDYQNRLLQRKLEGRYQKMAKSNTNLKYNSTKTSLLSQSSQQKYTNQQVINHIFQQQLKEQDQELGQKQDSHHLLATPLNQLPY